MLQPSSSQPDPVEPAGPRPQKAPAEAPVITFEPGMRAGDKLAEARRQLGLSLEEVADRIRVRREFLEALEAMNVKLLPGKAYALAFLRSYVQLLGIEKTNIVEQFQDECALSREDATKQIRNPSSKPHPERPWLAAAALVLIAGGFVAWRTFQHDEAKPAAAAHNVVLAPTQASAATQSTAEARVVEIKALTQAWLEARGPDGTVFLSRTMQPGEVYRPDPSPGWTLHARDGAAFEVFVNGNSIGPLGTAGMPVLGRPVDGLQAVEQAQLAPRS